MGHWTSHRAILPMASPVKSKNDTPSLSESLCGGSKPEDSLKNAAVIQKHSTMFPKHSTAPPNTSLFFSNTWLFRQNASPFLQITALSSPNASALFAAQTSFLAPPKSGHRAFYILDVTNPREMKATRFHNQKQLPKANRLVVPACGVGPRTTPAPPPRPQSRLHSTSTCCSRPFRS